MESTSRNKLSGQTISSHTNYNGIIYYLPSSVLGRTLSELEFNGNRRVTNIYAAGALLAKQQRDLYNQNDEIVWTHTDPQTGSALNTSQTGAAVAISHKEYDPLGNGVPLYDLGRAHTTPGVYGEYDEIGWRKFTRYRPRYRYKRLAKCRNRAEDKSCPALLIYPPHESISIAEFKVQL
jgi:hypothetical protein